MESVHVGILTVSDSCSSGKSVDISGNNLAEFVESRFGQAGWKVSQRHCVPDEQSSIKEVLLKWSDEMGLQLILTTGGTGFSPRDVTPEATKQVIQKEVPGLSIVMMTKSLAITPMAVLSRAVSGIRNRTLIINLPGSSKGAKECFQFVSEVLPHALDVLNEATERVTKEHIRAHGGHTCGGHHHHQTQSHHHHHHHIHHHVNANSSVDPSRVAHRHRQSPFPMISVKEAQQKVLELCSVLGTEKVYFTKALGRVLAEDVFAKDPLPPFRASTKDGYAVFAGDGIGPRPVVGDSNAGSNPDCKLLRGSCIRINTGAPVPSDSDAVVQVEDTKLLKSTDDGRTELEVEILVQPVVGQDIRPIGSDIQVGSKVLPAHTRLGSAELGILAAVGATEVEVYRLPKVALLSTGDEIQDPISKPQLSEKSGYIRDSNKTTLSALIEGENGFPVVDCGIARDDVNMLLEKLKLAFKSSDLVVTTGGVSMGDRDLLRQVLVEDFKADLHFARVNMKPGKPTTFATVVYDGKKKLILGLPGNPVSSTVTAYLYVLPACRKMAGQQRPFPSTLRAKINYSVTLDPRPEYQRVVLSWNPGKGVAEVSSTGNQISSRLESLCTANGLLILPGSSEGLRVLEPGTELDAMIIGPLLSE